MPTATAKKAKAPISGTTKPKRQKDVIPQPKLPHKVTAYTLKFAELGVPVALYTAARDEKIELHQYHYECKKPVKHLGSYCPECNGLTEKDRPESLDPGLTLGEVRLSEENIFKGFDAGDRIIPITEEEIDEAKPASAQVIEVLEFVNADEIDSISLDSSFYLLPNTTGGANAMKTYALLRSTLEQDNKIAVARVVKSRREYLAFIRPYGDNGLILFTAFMYDEIRQVDFPELPALSPREIAAGRKLLARMTNEWDPTKYRDSYRENVNAIIAAKREGIEPPRPQKKVPIVMGEDLMERLQASLAMTKKRVA